jgi:heterodisulfide reductase subunit A-like polyferredoxin
MLRAARHYLKGIPTVLRSLAATGRQRQAVSTDLLVIGADIAGLLVASRLQQKGIRSVVVESGSEWPQHPPRHRPSWR